MSRSIGPRRILLLANLALAGTLVLTACSGAAAAPSAVGGPGAQHPKVLRDPENPAWSGHSLPQVSDDRTYDAGRRGLQ